MRDRFSLFFLFVVFQTRRRNAGSLTAAAAAAADALSDCTNHLSASNNQLIVTCLAILLWLLWLWIQSKRPSVSPLGLITPLKLPISFSRGGGVKRSRRDDVSNRFAMRFLRKTDRTVNFSFVASRFRRVAPPSDGTLKMSFTENLLRSSLLVYVINIYRNWTRAVTHQSRTHTFKDAKADYACAYLNLAVGKRGCCHSQL